MRDRDRDRFFELSSEMFCVVDADGRFRRVNRSFAETLGCSRDEIVGRTFRELVHPDDLEASEERMERLREGAEVVDFVNRLRTSDGEWRYFAWRSRMEDGAVYGVARDVTGERRRRKEMERSEQRYRSLFEHNPSSVVVFDLDGRFVAANPATEEVTGHPRDELEGRTFHELLDPEVRDATLDRFRRTAAGETLRYDTAVRHRDGRRIHLEVTTVPIVVGGEVEGVYGIAHEITDRKRLEERLMQSNRDLEQFAYVASHDLQEPIRMVSGYLELLEERYGDRLDEDAHEFIDFAVDGAHRMKKMISDLLDFSRVRTRGGDLVPVDADEALDRVLSGLETLIEEEGATVRKDGRLPTVRADASQLQRVLQNLIVNAIRHGGKGVTVAISAEAAGDHWEFAVADDGPGIPADQTDRVFRIFESLQRPNGRSSTGIGLAICRRIVERHGGRIWVESEEGRGATFRFTIPAPSRVSGSAAGSSPRDDSEEGNSGRRAEAR